MVHTAAAADEQQLARLGFVPQVAERGTETAQKFYHAAKDAAPAPVAAQLSRAEEAVSGYVAPYVVKAQVINGAVRIWQCMQAVAGSGCPQLAGARPGELACELASLTCWSPGHLRHRRYTGCGLHPAQTG